MWWSKKTDVVRDWRLQRVKDIKEELEEQIANGGDPNTKNRPYLQELITMIEGIYADTKSNT